MLINGPVTAMGPMEARFLLYYPRLQTHNMGQHKWWMLHCLPSILSAPSFPAGASSIPAPFQLGHGASQPQLQLRRPAGHLI